MQVGIAEFEGVNDSTWVYYSLEKGGVVGNSKLLSKEEDELWANRLDWDFAICGDMIRTNSGTSGKGDGGLIFSDEDYNTIFEAPIDGYAVDSNDVIIKED